MKMYYSSSWDDYDIIDFKLGLLKSYYDWKNKKFERPEKCNAFFLDCGAFSAWTQKEEIDLDKYIEYIKKNKKNVTVYAALDDITSHKISIKNYKIMRKHGLDPLPAFHYGEPFEVLYKYLESTNYVALGGIAKLNKRERNIWLENVFSEFPDSKKVGFHGYGIQDRDIIKRYPWKSVDASSWHVMARYGGICTPWGDIKINIKVQYHSLRWLTPESEKKLSGWVESIGRDYNLAKQQSIEGSKERMAINLIYYEEVSKECPTVFKIKNKQQTLFGV